MQSQKTDTPTQFLGYFKKTIPQGWRYAGTSTITFVLALTFLYVIGQNVQVVAELYWVIAIAIALFFTFTFRLFNEILCQPAITRGTRLTCLFIFAVLYLAVGWFGFHGTVKRMDSAEIVEYRSRSYYWRETPLIKNVVGTDGVIRNKTFEGCRIVGPAVLYVITDIYLEQSRNSLELDYTIVPDNVRPEPGAIRIDNCRFIDSWFENVSIIGSKDEIERIRQNIVVKSGGLD